MTVVETLTAHHFSLLQPSTSRIRHLRVATTIRYRILGCMQRQPRTQVAFPKDIRGPLGSFFSRPAVTPALPEQDNGFLGAQRVSREGPYT